MIIFLLIIHSISSQAQTSLINTAKLTPLQTFDNGARVMQSTLAVQNIGTYDIEWGVTTWGQQGWHFIVSIPNTFGFDATRKSSISLTVNGPSMHVDTDDLIFGFTTNNQDYASMSVPMDNRGRGTKIYPPACNTLGHGDIAGLPTNNRGCDVAGGNCANWQTMPTINAPVLPLTIKLINNPIIGVSALYLSTSTTTINLNEYCKYTAFSTMDGLKIYIAAKTPGSSLLIESFDISSEIILPTAAPTVTPSLQPTQSPSANPSPSPTNIPTTAPTPKPSAFPTISPTNNPSTTPTRKPSNIPTRSPTHNPTLSPSKIPTLSPSMNPTLTPSHLPTLSPSGNPTKFPSNVPSKTPTNFPSANPSSIPTRTPSHHPTLSPSRAPTIDPTEFPTHMPSLDPTKAPQIIPTLFPSRDPTFAPNTQNPTLSPTYYPTATPSLHPTISSLSPSHIPTNFPTQTPSSIPTAIPSSIPTASPLTLRPTKYPTVRPSRNPSYFPSSFPSATPSAIPSNFPSSNPILPPSVSPTTAIPTSNPVPIGFEWGAHEQLCELNTNANANAALPPKQCQLGGNLTSNILGITQCNQAWDCCKCDRISCGVLNSQTESCDAFRVIGNSAAFGVKNIQIYGDSTGISNGADIECHGIEGCRQTVINAQHVDSIVCDAARSCMDAHFIINEPNAHFLLECAGIDACYGLQIEINLKGPPPGYRCANMKEILPFSTLACSAEGACHGLNITVNNEGCKNVVFDRLDCQEVGACTDANFDFIGNVDIGECLCGPSCQSASGLSKCFQNLPKIVCGDPRQCFGQIQTILNPMNGFLFECSDVESCAKGNFELLIDLNSLEPVTTLEGFKIGGTKAAMGTTFVINNEQRGAWLTIETIECSGTFSCIDATFITGNNVIIEDVTCGANACQGCILKQTAADVGIPCHSDKLTIGRPF